MTTPISCAESVEALTGPDRELDAIIAATCRLCAEKWPWAHGYPAWEGRADGRVYLEKGGPSFAAPAYTASLDAAMSLVPEGCPSRCAGTTDDGRGYAELARHDGHMMAQDPDEWWYEGNAATPALALTAAALRARASQEQPA